MQDRLNVLTLFPFQTLVFFFLFHVVLSLFCLFFCGFSGEREGEERVGISRFLVAVGMSGMM